MTIRSKRPAVQPGTSPDQAAAYLASQEITTTGCRRCGTEISGVNGRYSCAGCGWVNPWSEGHKELPVADPEPTA